MADPPFRLLEVLGISWWWSKTCAGYSGRYY
jgi:hypothetical protein